MSDDTLHEPHVAIPISRFGNVSKNEDGDFVIELEQLITLSSNIVHDLLTHGMFGLFWLDACEDVDSLHLVLGVDPRERDERDNRPLSDPPRGSHQ